MGKYLEGNVKSCFYFLLSSLIFPFLWFSIAAALVQALIIYCLNYCCDILCGSASPTSPHCCQSGLSKIQIWPYNSLAWSLWMIMQQVQYLRSLSACLSLVLCNCLKKPCYSMFLWLWFYFFFLQCFVLTLPKNLFVPVQAITTSLKPFLTLSESSLLSSTISVITWNLRCCNHLLTCLSPLVDYKYVKVLAMPFVLLFIPSVKHCAYPYIVSTQARKKLFFKAQTQKSIEENTDKFKCINVKMKWGWLFL